MNSARRVALVAVLLIGAFAVGAIAYRLGDASAPAVSVANESTNLDMTPGTVTAAAPVPKILPEFTLPDLEGKPHSIREWSGRPLLINFWATWCAPCREEIPLLNRIRREQRLKDLEIVGIAVDIGEDVGKYVVNTPLAYPTLVGEDGGSEAAAAFGVRDLALPFTVFVDRKGEIVALHIGQLHEDQALVILDALGDLDSGRIDLAAAQERVAARLRR